MPIITPLQFLQTLHPEPLDEGHLVLWTETARTGKRLAHWMENVEQAARFAREVVGARDVYACLTPQRQAAALLEARTRRPKVRETAVWGTEASTVLLSALWVEIELAAGREPDGCPRPPGRAEALELLSAVPREASIIVDTHRRLEVYWLLAEPLTIETAADRGRARRLLRRVQEAVARAGRDRGWEVSGTAHLAQRMRLPGTLNHAFDPPREIEVERFPTRAGMAAARYRARDFSVLTPPAAVPPVDARLLRGVPARFGGGLPGDFLQVAAGCSFIRYCLGERFSLSPKVLKALIAIAVRCAVPGAFGIRLAHRICRGHAGYSPSATDDYLLRALSREPPTCEYFAGELRARKHHCAGCPHFARGSSPLALGLAENPAARPAATGAAAGTAADDRGDRPEILVTGRQAEVNDRALAALAAAGTDLFACGAALVERLAEAPGESGERPREAPELRPVSGARLRELLARHCAFVREVGGRRRPAPPPRWTVRAILSRGAWPELRQLPPAELPDKVRPAAGAAERDLVRGVAEVLEALAAPATCGEILAQLARRAGRRRFAGLAAALAAFPAGEPPTATRLARRLGALRGCWIDGLTIERTGRTRHGVLWAVRRLREEVRS